MYKLNIFMMTLIVASGTMMGCGGGSDAPDRPATTPTTGTVTYKGAPVEGATVTFKPDADSKAAFGKTDAEGKFTLTTFEGGDGAIPGTYKVSVVKMEEVASAAVPMDDPNYDPTIEEPEPKSLLPEKYNNPANSGITATIGTEGDEDIAIILED